MSSDNVTLSMEGRIALVGLDDGKANALSPETIARLNGVLDEAENAVDAVVITGREGRFSGGFDLSVMMSGNDAARDLVTSGAELLIRLYSFPLPVTVACSGHAVAAGALLLLAADTRIGARGAFKIGLNEVAIGMRLPVFASILASERLSKRHFTAATQLAQLYDPEAAVDAGYLDRVVDADVLIEEALGEAKRWASLPRPAFRSSRKVLRGAAVESMRETLVEDMARVEAPDRSPHYS